MLCANAALILSDPIFERHLLRIEGRRGGVGAPATPVSNTEARKRASVWLSMTMVASRLVIGVAAVFVGPPTMSEDVCCAAQKDEHHCSMLYQLHDDLSIAMQPTHAREVESILN